MVNLLATLALGVAVAGATSVESGRQSSASVVQDPAATDTANPRLGSAYYEFLLGLHHESSGDVDAAIAAYQRASNLDPRSAEISAELAALYARLNRAREAIAAGEAALRIQPDNTEAHRVLGTVYAALAQNTGSSDAAGPAVKEHLTRAIKHLEQAQPPGTPAEPGVQLMLGRLYLRADMPGKAADLLARFVRDQPEYSDGIALLVQAYTAAGNSDAARALLEDLSRSHPQYYAALAELYERDRNWAKAADAYAKAAAANVTSSDLYIRWATALLNAPGETRTAEAREMLKKLVDENPGNNRALYLLCQVERRVKDFTAAESAARRMIANDSKQLLGPYALAQVFADKQDYRQIVDTIEPLVGGWQARAEAGQRPDVARLFVSLGFAYQELGQSERAVTSLEQARRFSSDPSILFQLGSVFERQKRYEQAERTFRETLAADPRHAPTLNYLGYMLADRGERVEEAVDYIKRALEIEPDNPSYLDSLGWAYYKLSRLELAEPPLRRASEELPTNSVVQDHWGDLLFKLGRYRDAIAAWQRSLAGDGESIEKSAVDRKIKAAREKVK